ncbi:uncharacterized protein LOC18427986 isoform X2 [Amborella trichopoda]|uniref:uncharacterized protein LOC18427986 isoform X2 n=1 Tax=Amborella trichopoda TaxID=13333 RepID=UPI0009C0EED9|nr:uncharacterized protein LOC18427986 isoform X2 [Amborella trichopoda]|eukprot:XP_020519153.1 uncharacterized protein LOC18427986 isoform X2 [Amborella trichopoda]
MAQRNRLPDHSGHEHDRRVKGSEIFIGGMPRSVTEKIIKEVFSAFGEIAEIRLMKDKSGIPKGFCFVRYTTKQAALRAQKEKDQTLLLGKRIGVAPSSDQDSLFLGNLRKEWGFEELDKMIREVFEDVVAIDLAMPPSSTGSSDRRRQNRGFAFVRFPSHAAAARAHRVGNQPDFLLGGKWHPSVDWADRETDVDPEELAKVKIAFVANLPNNINEEHLERLFNPFGKDLDNAINELDGKTVEGPEKGTKFSLEVSVARPDNRDRKRTRDESQEKISHRSEGRFKSSRDSPSYRYSDNSKSKAPRLTKGSEVPVAADPYEAAVLSLPPAVTERLLRIFRLGIATRYDLDIGCITSLGELSEVVAVSVLDQFMQNADRPGKGAYLSGLISGHEDERPGLNRRPLQLSRGRSVERDSGSVRVGRTRSPDSLALHAASSRFDSYIPRPSLYPSYTSPLSDELPKPRARLSTNGDPVSLSSYRAAQKSSGGYGGLSIERDSRFGKVAEREPHFGPGLERDAHLGSSLERETSFLSGLEREPRMGSGFEREPRAGTGFERESHAGTDFERESRAGTGFERDTRIGPGYERGTRIGLGYDIEGRSLGLERETRTGSGTERQPQVKFDPFTGTPYKFDPFTGEPIQPDPAPRRAGSYY